MVSLSEAQAYAMKAAYAMQHAALDEAKADRDIKERAAAGLPQVSLVADYSQYIDIPTQVVPADAFGFPQYLNDFLEGVAEETGVELEGLAPDPNALSELQFGQDYNANVGIQATQLVFSGTYIFGLHASRLFAQSRKQATARTADAVRRQVAEAYHLVQASASQQELLLTALDLVGENLAESQALFSEGFLNQTAVDQLELALRELESEKDNARTQEQLARALLRFQMGTHPKDELILTDSLDELMNQEGALEWMSCTFDPGVLPGIQEQRSYVELAEIDVKNQKAKGWPQVSAFYTNQGNAQRNTFDFLDREGNWYPVQLWGMNFSMPIWTSFGGKQRVEKKRIQEDRAKLGLRQMEQAAEMEYQNARFGLDQATANLGNRSAAKEISSRIYTQTRIAFQEGVATSFELTQARNQQLEGEGKMLSSKLDWLNARVRLQAALSEFE